MEKQDKTQFEAILNECLERMEQGATLEQCLGVHPEHARELRPLLALARELRSSLGVGPSAEARMAGRRRLQQAILSPAHGRASRLPALLGPWKGWATAGILAVVLFVGGFGVVQASSDSVPGEALYPVKRTLERARLSRPFQSREDKTDFSAELASRRAEEMVVLARENKTRHLPALADRVDANVVRVTHLSVALAERDLKQLRGAQAPPERLRLHRQRLLEVRERLQRDYRASLEPLRAIASQAPAEARPHIRQAAERLRERYQGALQQIDAQLAAYPRDSRPSSRPPGERLGPEVHRP